MSSPNAARWVADTAQSILGCLGVIVFVLAGWYCQFVRTANEIGPVGMDTDGRGILLETLAESVSSRGAQVGSEWEDSNLLVRLLIQEPMRTTFRIRTEQTGGTGEEAQRGLDASYVPFPDEEPLWLTKHDKIAVTEFNARLAKLGVRTFADLLAAMGFRRYEFYAAGQLVFATDLPRIGSGNVKIAGLSRN